MLFNSLHFLIFFPLVAVLYYLFPIKSRTFFLLLSSYYFYMCWNPTYVILLLLSTISTYTCGLFLTKTQRKQACIAMCIILNLSILIFFKYSNLIILISNKLLSILNIKHQTESINLLLPIGISFYTFQSIGYLIDVYRNKVPVEKNFFRYALFVSFFPVISAGPIERSTNLLVQLKNPLPLTWYRFREGLLLMLWGFFLKIVLADRIALFVNTAYNDPITYNGWYLIIATLLFAIQIYCDFSGYSIIAMGTAKILGFDLIENFNAPYFSATVSEFWNRWHISLSSWFKDYLYIPLGGNRHGLLRKQINKMIVFLVSGLWHGANVTFLVWGGLNGLYQVVGELLLPIRRFFSNKLHISSQNLFIKAFKIITTFILIDFAWIFFKASGIHTSLQIVQSIIHAQNLNILIDGSLYQCSLNKPNFILMLICISILILADICKYKHLQIRKVLLQQKCWLQWLIFSMSLCFILLFGIWGNAYNASNFIYFQF